MTRGIHPFRDRRQRIAARQALGTAGYFDRYTAHNEHLAERIASLLTRLTTTCLPGKRISSNAPSGEELKDALMQEFEAPSRMWPLPSCPMRGNNVSCVAPTSAQYNGSLCKRRRTHES